MAKKVKIRLTRSGPRELRQLAEVRADLERRAHAINQAAGGIMDVDSAIGPRRARAAVAAVSLEARTAEAVERRLTRALDAGRA